MAAQLVGIADTGLTNLVAVGERDADGYVWSTVAWVLYNASNIADYAVALTEGVPGRYYANNPDSATASTWRIVQRAGSTLAVNDLTAGLIGFCSVYEEDAITTTGTSASSAASSAATAATAAMASAGYASTAATNTTSILAKLGAITGSGFNTVLGYFQSIWRADVTAASDLGGTATSAADSLEAIGGIVASLAASGGTGSRLVTITVQDGSNGNAPIQAARVRIYLNSSDNQEGATDVDGQIQFASCADGTYTVLISYPGYIGLVETLVVASNVSPAPYIMTQISLPTSPAGFTTGYTYTYDNAGNFQTNVPICYQLTSILVGETAVSVNTAVKTVKSGSGGLTSFLGLLKGGTYNFWRGGEKTNNPVISIAISATAASTTALPPIWGTP